jgi:hypothetical protein
MVTDHRAGQNSPATRPSGAAMGLILFAGIMMIMVGVFQAIQGVVALFNDTFSTWSASTWSARNGSSRST